MKKSNKLLLGLFIFIIVGMLIVNITLRKVLKSSNNVRITNTTMSDANLNDSILTTENGLNE